MAAKSNGSGGKDGPRRARRAVRSTSKGGAGGGSGKRGKAGSKSKLKGKSRKHPDPEVIEFGHRLRRLRNEVGKTQEQVARKAELHWSYVGQIERGERNLTYLNILRLARGLELPPGRLVDDDRKG